MHWFASLRTRRWLRLVDRATDGAPGVSAGLATLPLEHLRSIAHIAERVTAAGAPARWAFRVGLPALLSDAQWARRLEHVSETALPSELDHLVLHRARGIVREIAPALGPAMPNGCTIDEHRAAHAVLGLLRGKTPESQIQRQLGELVRRNPEAVLVGFPAYVEREAAETYAALGARLAELTPAGLTPNDSECLARLQQLIRDRHSAGGDVAGLFVEEYTARPANFIDAYNDWINREAERALAEGMAAVRTEAGFSTLVDDVKCRRLLQDLLRRRTPLEALLQEFAACVRRGPQEFLLTPDDVLNRLREQLSRTLSGLEHELGPTLSRLEPHALTLTESLLTSPGRLVNYKLDRERCLDRARRLITAGVEAAALPERLAQEVRGSPYSFFRRVESELLRSAAPKSSGADQGMMSDSRHRFR